MEEPNGDEYLRGLASWIRTNERGLAENAVAVGRRRRSVPQQSWFSAPPPRPVTLSLSTDRLFYILVRLEALGIRVGPLDVRVTAPARPMSYVGGFVDADKSDARSLTDSIRSSLSAVSALSLGAPWWFRVPESSIDDQLRYIYSSFTKIPSLAIAPPSSHAVHEAQNAIPLESFKNLQFLDITDVDPTVLLGWSRLADGLVSLRIRHSGLADFSSLFIDAVLTDQQKSLPSSKWALLHSLALPANELTFFPASLLPLPPHPPLFPSLTSLDLSSNLLVSVPPSLSSLVRLRYLNLSDNMIDSVLHIYQNVGSIQSINLSKNRLSSICGLERLLALETVDLRDNYIEESSEIGRLATVPTIKRIRVDGNPLTEFEENYRVACFELFLKEGKEISLDGTGPGILERRLLPTVHHPPDQMTSSRPLSTVTVPSSPPTVAVVHKPSSPASSPAGSPSPTTSPLAPPIGIVATKSKRKKRAKRIVDLDGLDENDDDHTKESMKQRKDEEEAARLESASSPSSPPQRPRLGRHSRHRTEFGSGDYMPEGSTSRYPMGTRNFSTLGSGRSQQRRARVSASVYEPGLGIGSSSGRTEEEREEEIADSAEAYRRRIEALKRDMGDGWLRIFAQEAQSRA